MPAASLRITSADGFQEWVATPEAEFTPAGLSVRINIVHTKSGLIPPPDPTNVDLNIYNDAGALIAFASLNSQGNDTRLFFFTDNGLSDGVARSGTVEIALRVSKTTIPTYDIETDGNPNTPPAGFTTVLQRGWIVGTTTAITTISNVALGGAKTSPAKYKESLFVRTTLAAPLYVARALTQSVSGATPALSSVTAASSAGPWDSTFANIVTNRFPTGATVVNTSVSVPNAVISGQPDTVLTTQNDSLTVDPRITFTKLLQLNDSVFGTPPMSKNEIRGQRLPADLGFLAARAVDSRGFGINGLAWTCKLWDTGMLVSNESAPVKTQNSVGTTKGGEDGWSNTFLIWDSQLPGGSWTQKMIITTTDAIGLEVSNTRNLILPSINPNLIPVIGGGVVGDDVGRHWSPGLPFYIHMSLHDHRVHTYAAVDASPAPGVHIYRHNNITGKDQSLEANGITWTNVLDSDAPRHSLAPGVDDPNVYTKTFTAEQTAAWGLHDIHLIGHINNNSTPYGSDTVVIAVSELNDHREYARAGWEQIS